METWLRLEKERIPTHELFIHMDKGIAQRDDRYPVIWARKGALK